MERDTQRAIIGRESREGGATSGSVALRRGPPCLWFTRLPLHDLLACIRERHFGDLAGALALQFATQPELAELDVLDGGLRLSLHQVLNHADTPAEVFGTLVKRALWSVRRARRRGDAARGPAFFTICPEEPFAEAWLDEKLGRCLRRSTEVRDGHHEVEVTSGWRPLWYEARTTTPVLSLKRALAEAELQRLLRRLG